MMKHTSLLCLPLAASLLAACGSDSADSTADAATDTANDTAADTAADDAAADAGADPAADAGADAEEDVATIGDVGTPEASDDACPRSRLIEVWPLHNELAVGDGVDATEVEGVYTLIVDASAGGTSAAADNAFVYVNLASVAGVVLTDTESLDATDWHLAFRRTAIRLNSADSGPLPLAMARLQDTTLEAVTTVPGDDATWAVDATFSRTCTINTDPIGTPYTAMNYLNVGNPSGSESWYDYGADGVSAPVGVVYVVRDTESGDAWKFEIDSWDNGVYTLRYAAL